MLLPWAPTEAVCWGLQALQGLNGDTEPNVLYAGDMNWNPDKDGEVPLPRGWYVHGLNDMTTCCGQRLGSTSAARQHLYIAGILHMMIFVAVACLVRSQSSKFATNAANHAVYCLAARSLKHCLCLP